MLSPQRNPLSVQHQLALRQLLQSETIGVLRRVVEAKAIMLCTEAVNDSYKSSETNAMLESAKGRVVEAQKYRHFIEVLEEVTKEDQHSTIIINTTP